MALIDFTLSNARRFYSSMGNPSGLKGLNHKTVEHFTTHVKIAREKKVVVVVCLLFTFQKLKTKMKVNQPQD